MTEPLDALDLPGGRRLAILEDGDGHTAVPMLRDGGGRCMRARPGDGAAEALLTVLSRGSATAGRFTITSWSSRAAAGERPVGVDQTNESVIVGDAAVVKWATHLQMGPHPAPHRISVLRDAGFTGMPMPWGLVTWRTPGGAETLVASADEYLPAAVDGWTWAVDLITTAAVTRDLAPMVEAATALGGLIADLHAALARTATPAGPQDAARWHATALETLELVCTAGESVSITTARERRPEIVAILDELGTLASTTLIEGHGDLHVGQVLRTGGRFVVTDFDGNPVLPAQQRMLPIPAVLDVAGMTQSLTHAALVARKHTDLEDDALAEVADAGRTAFLGAYSTGLGTLGHTGLYLAAPLRAFRLQQVLREIIYAAEYLPRWMYVPDSALPALLDEKDHNVKPDGFLADLRRKPEVLTRLAELLGAENPWAAVVPRDIQRVVLLGMGSSAYAGGVAAARMRARGLTVTSELASSALLPAWGSGTLVVATSASGGSVETLDALRRLPDGVATMALTNTADSAITQACAATVDLHAGPEVGGVACRSYQHTLALLIALECHLTATDTAALTEHIGTAAAATQHLIDTESDWRPALSDLLLGPSGTHLTAPAQRFCSAQQGALMLREGPRLPAVGCETGDWSHVDVYLTKTTDYRLLVFAGSAWERQLAEWTTLRGSTVVGVGGSVPGAGHELRYPGDADDDVRLLTEVLVPELIAARAWQE